jgi:succinate dehydrogenase hydrophobic anchor subunit
MQPGSERSLTSRWFLQSTLGILLLVLLGVHLIANHWIAPNGLMSYADVIRYFDTPGIAWMEIVFLIMVTAHCLMGIHAILLDLSLSSTLKKVLSWMLITMGIVMVVYGVWLTWQLAIL